MRASKGDSMRACIGTVTICSIALCAGTLALAAPPRAAGPGTPRRSPNPETTQPTQSGKPRPSSAERDRWDRWMQQAAKRRGFDWLLAKAVRIKESFDDPWYVSTTGAVGLMQLMPPAPRSRIAGGKLHITAAYRAFLCARRSRGRRFQGKTSRQWGRRYQRELRAQVSRLTTAALAKLDSRFDPRWNVRRGVNHLAADWARFRRRYRQAKAAQLRTMTLAAYYAGPGRVRFVAGRVRIPSYTRAYVADVLAVHARLRRGLLGR
jgi:soluble lytic murein transglycosylase-like protein